MIKKKIRQYGDKFRIQDFTSKDNLDTTKFYEVRNKNGNKVLEGEVIILYEDEYATLIEENQSLKSSLEDYKSTINDKESTIQQLKGEKDAKDQSHNTKVNDLSNQISQLKEDIIELEKKHLQEKSNIQLEHQKEINDLTLYDEEYHMKISDHEKALNTIRSKCLKLRVHDCNTNMKLISKLEGYGRFEKFRNKDNDTMKEMKEFNQKIIDEDAIEVHYNLIDKDNANND